MKSERTDPKAVLMAETSEHRMTILRDDGVYRHIRFAKPGTNMWRFDLVTWPGHLVITGDIQDYHFTRLHDMFEFFRSNPDRPHAINPQYWAEKLAGHQQQCEEYSFEAFKQSLVSHFWWGRDQIPEGHRREVWRSIREEILEDEGVQHSQDEAYRAASRYQYNHYRSGRAPEVWFEFTDVYDWHFKEYKFHFLLSLWAIIWGIHQYDTQPHKSEADWLVEDLRETRKQLAEATKKLNDLEGMHQDLINDVAPLQKEPECPESTTSRRRRSSASTTRSGRPVRTVQLPPL